MCIVTIRYSDKNYDFYVQLAMLMLSLSSDMIILYILFDTIIKHLKVSLVSP